MNWPLIAVLGTLAVAVWIHRKNQSLIASNETLNALVEALEETNTAKDQEIATLRELGHAQRVLLDIESGAHRNRLIRRDWLSQN